MKVYKTNPNKYGWYYVIHVTKRDIKIFHKVNVKNRKEYENRIQIHGDGIKLLKEVMRTEKG